MDVIKTYTEQDVKKFEYKDGSKVWFTSDTHFAHTNILRFCDRPFANTDEMDEYIIRKWNELVKPDDTVFHLGDVAWGGSGVWVRVLDRLNGHKVLIIGNHDMKNLRANYARFFDLITFQMQIIVEGQAIYLNHYPFLCYGGSYRKGKEAVWQLFGHVHTCKHSTHKGKDDIRMQYLFPTQYDVGVDNNDYMPINFYQVKAIIEKQIEKANYKPTWYERIILKIKKIWKTILE